MVNTFGPRGADSRAPAVTLGTHGATCVDHVSPARTSGTHGQQACQGVLQHIINNHLFNTFGPRGV